MQNFILKNAKFQSRVELPLTLISYATMKIICQNIWKKPPAKFDENRDKTKILLRLGKSETNYSQFINPIGNPERRRVASKFGIGNHNVKVETGRFRTPEDPRIWDHCNLNSVESEMPVLFHWDLCDDLRKTLFIKINDRNALLICKWQYPW